MDSICILTPTGCLGYGFSKEALKRGMSFKPDVIAVDAGSTDPGPYYLGSGNRLVSDMSVKQELAQIIAAARAARIPVVIGSAGGAGARAHVDHTAKLVREVIRELDIGSFNVARIYSDVDKKRVKQAIRNGDITNFEADFELTEELVDASSNLVAQMGPEPIISALGAGADVVIAGRACDDTCIAAYALMKGADPGLAIHMGKIMECGAFSAVPFAMDVMLGWVSQNDFVLEAGSTDRCTSLTSVAAHTLYERENPFDHEGPGYALDLSACRFDKIDDRRVRVSGSRYRTSSPYRIKLEGARLAGFRTIAIGGVRCPTMIPRIDSLLEESRRRALEQFSGDSVHVGFHVYGRDGVMGKLEPVRSARSHELGIVMEVLAPTQDLAYAVCHHLSGDLLHVHFEGQKNTAGNLAFLYSPSDLNVGPAYEFSAYHLMNVDSGLSEFPIAIEKV